MPMRSLSSMGVGGPEMRASSSGDWAGRGVFRASSNLEERDRLGLCRVWIDGVGSSDWSSGGRNGLEGGGMEGLDFAESMMVRVSFKIVAERPDVACCSGMLLCCWSLCEEESGG
jgi:hypothetical protein